MLARTLSRNDMDDMVIRAMFKEEVVLTREEFEALIEVAQMHLGRSEAILLDRPVQK